MARVFGQVLRDLRVRRGLSQERLAHESDLHRNSVAQLERGEKSPSLLVVFQLAATLEVTPMDIVRRVDRALRSS